MTRPEIKKLDRIIEKIERLHSEIDDTVAREQLLHARAALLNLYNSAKRDCEATEKARA